jgi:hypothetical protein
MGGAPDNPDVDPTQLPDNFQTAEYLLYHGLIDLIVTRSFLKQALSETLTFYKDAPFKEIGYIPSKLNLVPLE